MDLQSCWLWRVSFKIVLFSDVFTQWEVQEARFCFGCSSLLSEAGCILLSLIDKEKMVEVSTTMTTSTFEFTAEFCGVLGFRPSRANTQTVRQLCTKDVPGLFVYILVGRVVQTA